MTSYLPLGMEELLGGAVETARLELKASWDAGPTGNQVLKTLCAFANDLQNLNGGYIVIGVEERDGAVIRPAVGLTDTELDDAQKWIRGNCNRIEPIYMPVMSVEEFDGKRVLVLWAPASDVRPHQAPDGPKTERKYWVRIGNETVQARDGVLTTLMHQTARVPFDDRRSAGATNEDISLALVREFLQDVRSDLREEADAERIYRSMQIVSAVNGHTVPRNVALLFFSAGPDMRFRGARIEVVEFLYDAGGDVLTEKVFKGPLHHQVRQCLSFLESMTTRFLEKSSLLPETRGWLSFPAPAVREAVVNAVYHRSYEESVEPTKVYLYPNRVEVVSYPGPLPGIDHAHLTGGKLPPPVPARNRRIGEFLKELRLAEGRGTGVPKIRRSMSENGSPPPSFDFDESRSYFRVTLPAHPEYVALRVLRDYAYKQATGDTAGARAIVKEAWSKGMRSPSLAAALVREYARSSDLPAAEAVLASVDEHEMASYAPAITAIATAYADAEDQVKSKGWLNRLPPLLAARDAFDAAILERRLDRQDRAHRMFERAGDLVLQDVRALHEFAQTKINLTSNIVRSRRPADKELCRRLLREAEAYLERVIQMDAPTTRHAWAWFNLGQVRQRMQHPRQAILGAYRRAHEMKPDEVRFRRALVNFEAEGK